MKLLSPTLKFISVGILLFQLTACSVPGLGETWSLVEVVTTGDRVDTFTDTVTVQNCGIVQPKTITCSAGTTKDLSVSLGGGTELGEGAQLFIDGSVSTSLGIGRESGENVELETPPAGFVYVFTINKEYRVKMGEVIAQSSTGGQQTASYNFNANCSIQVVNKEQVSCSENEQLNEPSGTLDMPGEIWATDIQEAHIYEHQTVSEKDFSDFSYEADLRINDNSSEYHGLLFRHQVQGEDHVFYSFRITPDGYFAFDLWQDSPESSFTRLLGPSQSSAIRTGAGQVNHLKTIARGSQFELFINEQHVGTITDSAFSSGSVGFVSCTCDGSSSAAATFLNVKLSQNP